MTPPLLFHKTIGSKDDINKKCKTHLNYKTHTSTEISKILLYEMSEHDKRTYYLNCNYVL